MIPSNICLINELGQKINLSSFMQDKTVIINMFYSRCEIKCIPLGKLMRRVNLLLKNTSKKDNIHFISITLDAENDTVEDLLYFKNSVWERDESPSLSAKAEMCDNWHFYTGIPEDIEILRHKLGMYSPELEIDAVKSNHSGSFMIINSNGFVKHCKAFENPIEISRKIIQLLPRCFAAHSYSLRDLDYKALSDEDLFENIHTMNSMFTIPFLPHKIIEKYDTHAQNQRGFQYKPPIPSLYLKTSRLEKETKNKSGECCCGGK